MYKEVLQKGEISEEEEAKLIDSHVETRDDDSFVKKAFILSFYFLLKFQNCQAPETFYLDSIRMTMRLAGDADANATIVGGLIGALVGPFKLPQDLLKKVLDFDCTAEGTTQRPDTVSVRQRCVRYMVRLLQKRPFPPPEVGLSDPCFINI